MQLNLHKCVIVPLWFFTASIRTHLRELVPDAACFQIVQCGLYLGVYIGPGAGTKSWDKICETWTQATRAIKEYGVGYAACTWLYNSLVFSRTMFIASLRAPNASILKVEKRLV